MYMLDTNICIYVINKRPSGVLHRFENLSSDDLCISIVTFAELHYGVERSSAQDRNRQIVDDFTSRLEIRPWTGVPPCTTPRSAALWRPRAPRSAIWTCSSLPTPVVAIVRW